MPNLFHAYNVAINLGRNPSSLICNTYENEESQINDCRLISAEILGGSGPHLVTIEVSIPFTAENINNGQWHCDCPDFRFTFWPYIDQQGDSLGTVPEYVPNGRGQPRAIADYGMCKHVLCLINKLTKDNVFPTFTIHGDL